MKNNNRKQKALNEIEMMQYDEESKRLLSDFNDRIKAAAIALFNKTKTIHEGMMKLYDGNGDLEVEGKCC